MCKMNLKMVLFRCYVIDLGIERLTIPIWLVFTANAKEGFWNSFIMINTYWRTSFGKLTAQSRSKIKCGIL